jgi:uncharacterized membrane protein YkoI
MDRDKPRVPRAVVATAVAVGIAAGSYGIASAANDSGSSSSSSSADTAQTEASSSTPDPQSPWGGQRSDETLLTGDTASKVEAAAVAKVPNGTVVRVETDADGHAAYEVHMTKADGTPVTVYVDEDFDVVSVESR